MESANDDDFCYVDHGHYLNGAQEAASAVIDLILTEGGRILWQKYLQEKAFAFASESITEAVASELEMCFVPHDKGEQEDDEDAQEWAIEEEPIPGCIDSWARMQLQARRRPPAEEKGAEILSPGRNAVQNFEGSRRVIQRTRSRAAVSDTSRTSGRPLTKIPSVSAQHSRACPIQEDRVPDAEEEKLRDVKTQEEIKKREQESRARVVEKVKDEERRKAQELMEEMALRPHTFDIDGNIIWVDEVNPAKLPNVQTTAGFGIKKDARRGGLVDAENTLTRTSSQSNLEASPQHRGNRAINRKRTKHDRSSKTDHDELEFTDSFSKLQHMQPPVLDTMKVQSGVILEQMGRRRAGPDDNNYRQMSRKEYVMLAAQEAAVDGFRVGSQDSPSGSGGPQISLPGHEADNRGQNGQATKTASPPQGAVAAESSSATTQGIGTSVSGGAAAANKTSNIKAQSASSPVLGKDRSGSTNNANAAKGTGSGNGTGIVNDNGGSPSLPQIRAGRGPGHVAGGGAANTSLQRGSPKVLDGSGAGVKAGDRSAPSSKGNSPAKVPKAPPVPPMSVRAKQSGHLGRQPRFHVPSLGGVGTSNLPQPVLGATMGHGLVRSDSAQDFYFPSPKAELPTLSRARSEAVLQRERNPSGPEVTSPARKKDDAMQNAGRILPQRNSAAWRTMQQGLVSEGGLQLHASH